MLFQLGFDLGARTMNQHDANACAVQQVQIVRYGDKLALIDNIASKRDHEGAPAEGVKIRRNRAEP